MDTPNANPVTTASASGAGAASGSPGPVPEKPAAGSPSANAGSPAESAAQKARVEEAARLAALARRERHLQTQREHARRSLESETQRLKAEQEQLLKEREELKQLREARELAKTDPLKWLEFGGHTYESVTEAQLNGGKIAPERLAAIEAQRVEERVKAEFAKQEAELKKLREEQESLRRQREQETQSAAEAQMQEFRANAARYVQSQKDKYQIVTSLGRESEVAQLIEQHHAQSYQADAAAARREGRDPVGEVLSVDRAAELIEKWYEEQFEKAISVPKFQAKYKKLEPAAGAPVEGQPASQGSADAPAGGQPVKETVQFDTRTGGVKFERKTAGQRPTLTNQIAASVQSSLPTEGTPSESERIKRALAAMERVEAERRSRASQA